MKRPKKPTSKEKLEALREGRELPVDPATLWQGTPGEVPDADERAVLGLARAMHRAESRDVATSWSAQERAAKYYNAHGLARTLDEKFRLESLSLEGPVPVCSQCGASGLDASKIEGTAPEGFRTLCPGRLDGTGGDALFCESCSGEEPCQTCGRVHAEPRPCGTLRADRLLSLLAKEVKPKPNPAPLVLDMDEGTVRAESRTETKARKARAKPASASVRTGPVDPARAAKHEAVGLEDRKHGVWVTIEGVETKIGEGTPERCTALATELRESDQAAREAVKVVEDMERERLDERAARKGRGK